MAYSNRLYYYPIHLIHYFIPIPCRSIGHVQSVQSLSHAGLLPGTLLLHVVRVLPQDHEVLQDALLDRDELLGRQLGSFSNVDQHRRGMGLETSNLLGLAGLSHHVNCLTHADAQRHGFKLVVELNRGKCTTKRDLGYMPRVRK